MFCTGVYRFSKFLCRFFKVLCGFLWVIVGFIQVLYGGPGAPAPCRKKPYKTIYDHIRTHIKPHKTIQRPYKTK